MSTNSEMEKHRANYVIQWKTPASQPEEMQREAQSAGQQESHRYSRAYRDPTADAAIGNIMREERMKKKQRDRKCQRNSTYQRNSNYQKERNRRRAEAWRTAKAQEAKAQEAQTNSAIQGGGCHVEK